MIRLRRNILRETRGAAIIEFAIALPVLTLFIWGIAQVGLLFQAYAGMQHALGEAARHATIFPTPSDDQIRAKVAAKFGTGNGNLSALEITNHNNAAGQRTAMTLQLTYSQQVNFIFFTKNVTVVQAKRVHLAAPTA